MTLIFFLVMAAFGNFFSAAIAFAFLAGVVHLHNPLFFRSIAKRNAQSHPNPCASAQPVPAQPLPITPTQAEFGVIGDTEEFDRKFTNLSPDTDDKPRRRKKPSQEAHGNSFDTIHFEYENAEGEYSARSVRVDEIGDEYIVGFCFLRRERRTFRLDSMLGDVTSEKTGEILDPFEWAKKTRRGGSRPTAKKTDKPSKPRAEKTPPVDIPDLPSDPDASIIFPGMTFCFTGEFDFGTRRDCEEAMILRGAHAGQLTQKVDYLVIGSHVSKSWKSEKYGAKIEHAVQYRARNGKPRIVTEKQWLDALIDDAS
ncbi:MAG: hypothetical protein FWD77_11745 [Betaproteobacteria bacterium]|nr:hypothetical protein [Betaproteobacteria bacterium]